MQKDLDLMRSVSIRDFINRMFHFFLVIFATNFNVIFKNNLFCSRIFKQTCT